MPAGGDKIGEAFVQLSADTTMYNAQLNTARSSLSAFGVFAKTVAASVGVYYGARLVKSILKAGQSQIDAEKRLASALGAHGDEVRPVLEATKQYAAELMKTVGIEDDVILSTAAMLRNFGVAPEKLNTALGAFAALTKGMGMGADAATKVAAMYVQGNVDLMGRYVPAIRLAKTESEKMAAATEFLESMMGAANAQTQTWEGSVNAAKLSLGELAETVSIELVGKDLAGTMRSIAEATDEAAAAFTRWANAEAGQSVFAFLQKMIVHIGAVKETLNATGKYLGEKSVDMFQADADARTQHFMRMHPEIYGEGATLPTITMPDSEDALMKTLNGITASVETAIAEIDAAAKAGDLTVFGEDTIAESVDAAAAAGKAFDGALDGAVTRDTSAKSSSFIGFDQAANQFQQAAVDRGMQMAKEAATQRGKMVDLLTSVDKNTRDFTVFE